MIRSIYLGYDAREADGYAVCRHSIQDRLTQQIPVRGLVLSDLQRRGLYRRPHERRGNQMWDLLSDAPMSTEFANSRFLVPHLAKSGWALFMDGSDMLVQTNLVRLFEEIADPQYAVMCVKHHHVPEASMKMDAQMQTRYARKNWSSVMLFNCDHEANDSLTIDMVNTLPGRDLHAFCWLEDDQIGTLGPEWNYLVGHTRLPDDTQPCIVHHTAGIPSMPGFEDVEYNDEWRHELEMWAA